MPVSVLMPHQRPEPREKQEVDPMDKILKGLNIAASIYGLKEAYDKGQMLKEDRELNKLKLSEAAKAKEIEELTITPKDWLNFGDKYNTVDANTPGARKFYRKEFGGKISEIYLTPKEKQIVAQKPGPASGPTKIMNNGGPDPYQTQFGLANTKQDASEVKNAYELKKSVEDKLDEMIALRQKHGGGATLDREDVQRGKQLSKELLLEYKNMMKLGVLSAADEKIINTVIPNDPLAYNSPVAWAQGQDPIMERLEKLKGDTNRVFQTKLETRIRGGGLSGVVAPQGIGNKMNVTGGAGLADLIQPKANAGPVGKKPAWAK